VENCFLLQNQLVSVEAWKTSVASTFGYTDTDLLIEHLKACGKVVCGRVGHVDVIKLVDPSNYKSREITQGEKGQ